jgi:hypothetical protein
MFTVAVISALTDKEGRLLDELLSEYLNKNVFVDKTPQIIVLNRHEVLVITHV